MNHERRQGIPVAAGHLAWLAGLTVVVLVGCGGNALPSRAPQEPAPCYGSNDAPVAQKLPAARSLALPALPALAPPSATVSATLAWDASPSAGDASFGGHILYWRATNDGVEISGNRVVGNVTTATISNLLRGVRYTFRATAYNVSGDVSGVLQVGQPYQVRNAADYYGSLVASGIYGGGNITLPMTNLSVATPVGIEPPPATDARFNVFVLQAGVSSSIRSATVNNWYQN